MPLNKNYSTLLTPSGELYSCGHPYGGALGLGDPRLARMAGGLETLTKVTFEGDSEVISVSSGGCHTIFATSEGILWGFGNGPLGQLGPATVWRENLPKIIQTDVFVVSCAVGEHHSVVIDSDGNLWGFGSNTSFQLGLEVRQNYREITKIPNISNVRQISADSDYTVAIDSQGTFWATGLNNFRQCAQESLTTEDNAYIRQFTILALVPKMKHISSSKTYIAAVSVEHELWIFGECCPFTTSESVRSEKVIERPDIPYVCIGNISKVFAFDLWLIVENLDGKLLSVTSNLRGWSPTEFDDMEIIACGYNTFFLYHRIEKKVYSFGENQYGQAGRPVSEKTDIYHPELVQGFDMAMKINRRTKSAANTVKVSPEV